MDSGGVELAVRDFRGSGLAIILLHGLGRSLIDWQLIAPLLSVDHRVVAFDLRCHGDSDDGAWSWGNALADVASVADHLDLANPAIAGHSLGGMLAVMWGASHPDCPGVVNLDGHGKKQPDQYVGLDSVDANQRQEKLDAVVQQSLNALAGPLAPSTVDALLAQQQAMAARMAIPDTLLVEAARRGLRTENGETRIRPAVGGIGSEILAQADAFDMLDLYTRVLCPVLIVNGMAAELGAGPEWIKELMAAYRKGIERDLADLARRQGNVRVVNLAASHALVFEQPQAIANEILTFLR
ncbi:MAG TPA: alpha/beta hydrolase [Candidatus Dormibacteraeota bacterium]|nr:alpha/beta hydrolase [Candidatus Dormibacteraeota bacterium]